jgi:hypothetical protein
VQKPESGDGERLIPPHHAHATERAGLRGDAGVGDGAAGAEHAGHIHGAHRLPPRRAEPAAYAPARHRDPGGDPGHAPRGLRRLQPEQQHALHQAAGGRRRVRLPAGAHPLPAQQRQDPRPRLRRAQQPVPRRDHHRQLRVRDQAADQRRDPRQGVHDREGSGRLDTVAVRHAGGGRRRWHDAWWRERYRRRRVPRVSVIRRGASYFTLTAPKAAQVQIAPLHTRPSSLQNLITQVVNKTHEATCSLYMSCVLVVSYCVCVDREEH